MTFLDCTILTLDEFQQLVSPFEVAFQVRMAAWCLYRTSRTRRQFAVYKNCTLLTPEEPDGGNLFVRVWRGAGPGYLPACSTMAFW
jgi:hypothetical protein